MRNFKVKTLDELTTQALTEIPSAYLGKPTPFEASTEDYLQRDPFRGADGLPRHLPFYQSDLEQRLPAALSYLANPSNWNVRKLLDVEKGVLRKPRVVLNADISSRQTFRVFWFLESTSTDKDHPERFPYRGGYSMSESLHRTDYSRTLNVSPLDPVDNQLVHIPDREYPHYYSERDGGPRGAVARAQRDAFLQFLTAMLRSLQASLDIRIFAWPAFDEEGRLTFTTAQYRLVRLARAQMEAALDIANKYEAKLKDKLGELGVTLCQLKGAVALSEESGAKITAALHDVAKVQGHAARVIAAVRLLDEANAAKAQADTCRAIYEQAGQAVI